MIGGEKDRRRGPPGGVKTGARDPGTPEGRAGFRFLEGWQAGIVIVALAALAALLAVPHPAAPDVLPLPHVDRSAQQRQAEARAELADRARRTRLPFSVRAAGDALRHLGRIAAGEVAGDLDAARRTLLARVQSARTEHGAGPLLQLRALQTELFLTALRGEGQSAPTDLTELGGDFARHVGAEGPLAQGPIEDLASAFGVRWSLLAGLAEDPAFAPPLNDWRASFRLRLRYPRATSTRGRALEQLETVRALEQKDPEYPGALARGILAYRLGEYATSAAALRVFLERRRRGPWQLRARNYLAAALELSNVAP